MNTRPPPTKPAAPAGAEHDALPPGTRFGEFEILRVVGVGGFGIVYLAQDHSLEREVALKEYMPASLAARGLGPQITVRSSSFAETYAIGLRSFVNEARLLARFDHPSLVKVYRFWEDNATAYMVMPFLQGVTLRDTRRGMAHPPDEAWIRSVISPILAALELLHREGVYHRDVAPDNILLSHGGPPVLLDFGAARRVISDRTQSLTAILKPSYAPIEQYAEMTQMRQGPWTDLYALGAVIHFLLFGVPPAPATARALQDDVEGIETRIVPGVSPRFLEVVAWMLTVRPAQRPQSCEELRAVLEGRAEMPPRGRPGVTMPGGAGAAPLGAPMYPGAEGAADATMVNTAHLPTHLPTTPAAPPAPMWPTTFSPTAQMPTARNGPTHVEPPRGATTLPPQRPPIAPGGEAHSPTGWPTTQQATQPAQPPASQPPWPPASSPQTATWAVEAQSSRPATLPPPYPPPPPAPPRRTQPAPLDSSAPAGSFGLPPPGAAVGTPGRGPGRAIAIAAGALVVLGVVAFGAWKLGGGRGDATSLDPAAVAPGGGTAAALPASAPAVVATPAPTLPLPTPTVPAPTVPAATTPPNTVPAVVAAPQGREPGTGKPANGQAAPRIGMPVPSAQTTKTATPSFAPPPTTFGGAGAEPRGSATAGRPAIGGTDAGGRLPGSDRGPFVERGDAGTAPGSDGGTVRGRASGRPVPRIGDDGSGNSGFPANRGADTTPYGSANTAGAGPSERPRPLGSPAREMPVPTNERPRPLGSVALPPAQSPPTRANAPNGAAPGGDYVPGSAREACGKRVFIALAVCMDERCEEPRFRNTAECAGILERKRAREGR